jgi:hypothetical protein
VPETPNPQFISEPIRPVTTTMDTRAMSVGAPSLPRQFQWRDEQIAIAQVQGTWRESGPCTHGSGETYAKKHWFEVTTTDGRFAKLYYERQPRGKRLERWWLYTITAV